MVGVGWGSREGEETLRSNLQLREWHSQSRNKELLADLKSPSSPRYDDDELGVHPSVGNRRGAMGSWQLTFIFRAGLPGRPRLQNPQVGSASLREVYLSLRRT